MFENKNEQVNPKYHRDCDGEGEHLFDLIKIKENFFRPEEERKIKQQLSSMIVLFYSVHLPSPVPILDGKETFQNMNPPSSPLFTPREMREQLVDLVFILMKTTFFSYEVLTEKEVKETVKKVVKNYFMKDPHFDMKRTEIFLENLVHFFMIRV